jgi:aminoglycoside 3-N-acetyltransferase
MTDADTAATALSRDQLAHLLRDLGLGEGDSVFVHSALRPLGPIEDGAAGVVVAIGDVVGKSGLIAVPTHTWAVVSDQQPVWHEMLTPSHVGALTNYLRLLPGAVRSLHPTHSVAAIGPRASEFCSGHERDDSPCSPTSPYGRLLQWQAKVLMLGVDLTRCTYFHCLEEMAGLGEIWSLDPIRRRRWLIRASGEIIPVLARGHLNYKSDNYHRVEAEMIAAGCLKRTSLKGAAVMLLDADAAGNWLIPRMRQDPKMFW